MAIQALRSKQSAATLLSLLLLLTASVVQAAFVHPGLLNSAEELAVIRTKISTQAEPWTGALNFMYNRNEGSLDYRPLPYARPYQGSYGEGDSGGWRMMMDARAAYLNALAWAITGDTARRDKAIEFVDAWSYQIQGVDGINAKLIAAAAVTGFANAAELLKHTNSGWAAADQAQAESMFQTVFYPLLRDFQPGYNGNWDAIITHAIISMGVLLDDQAMFDSGRNYFQSGPGNGSLPNYVRADGTTQETYRDAEHENMGIAGLTGSCEVARHQGVDLYGFLDSRLLAGAEGVAKRVADAWITAVPCWELLYNHYSVRLGNPMPETERVLTRTGYRPENYGLMSGIGYGTLITFPTAVPISTTSMGALKGAFGR
jgi:Alginate lyase